VERAAAACGGGNARRESSVTLGVGRRRAACGGAHLQVAAVAERRPRDLRHRVAVVQREVDVLQGGDYNLEVGAAQRKGHVRIALAPT
jgi:hypothetical protein